MPIATSQKWGIHHKDVKFVFFLKGLCEEIYMKQPLRFIQADFNLVCWFNKIVYGLMQAL